MNAPDAEQSFPGARRHTIVYDKSIIGGPVVVKCGYLVKQGYERKSWKRRFFTLAGHNLHYFRDDNMNEKLGMVPLAGCKIVQSSSRPFCFSISHPHRRVYYLCADSEHQKSEWMIAILEVITQIGDEDTLKNLETDDLPEFEDLLLSKAGDFPEVAELIKKQDSPTKCIKMGVIRAEDLCLQRELLQWKLYCKVEVTIKPTAGNPGTLEMVSGAIDAANSISFGFEFFFSLQQLKEEIHKVRIALYCTSKERTQRFVEMHPADVGATGGPGIGENDVFLGEVLLDPAKIIKAEKKGADNRWILKVPSSFKPTGSQSVAASHGIIYTSFSWLFLTPPEMYRLGKEKVGLGQMAPAKQLFQLAADCRFSAAVSALGWWYCHGYGTTAEESLGFELYQKAAAQGDKVAQNNVGYCYQYGIGTQANTRLARHWYTRAIEQSSFVPSYVNLGLMLLDASVGAGANAKSESGEKSGDPEKARGLFYEAARRGSPEGQNNLGYCLQVGIGGPQNSEEAFNLFLSAAKNGYAPAQLNVGQCYQYSLGVEKDSAEAFQYYQLGANQGHPEALLALGLCYETGYGCEQSIDMSKKIYERAFGSREILKAPSSAQLVLK